MLWSGWSGKYDISNTTQQQKQQLNKAIIIYIGMEIKIHEYKTTELLKQKNR